MTYESCSLCLYKQDYLSGDLGQCKKRLPRQEKRNTETGNLRKTIFKMKTLIAAAFILGVLACVEAFCVSYDTIVKALY